jgi:hypothetical protein
LIDPAAARHKLHPLWSLMKPSEFWPTASGEASGQEDRPGFVTNNDSRAFADRSAELLAAGVQYPVKVTLKG